MMCERCSTPDGAIEQKGDENLGSCFSESGATNLGPATIRSALAFLLLARFALRPPRRHQLSTINRPSFLPPQPRKTKEDQHFLSTIISHNQLS